MSNIYSSALAEIVRADLYRGELALLDFAQKNYRLTEVPGVRWAIGAYAYEKEVKLDSLREMYKSLGWRTAEKPLAVADLAGRCRLAGDGSPMRDLAAAAQMKGLEGALSSQYSVLERWALGGTEAWVRSELAGFRRSSLKPISMWWNAANRLIANDNIPDFRVAV